MNKPKVAKSASPAAVAMLRQATALAPLRKKASDGLLPSTAHLKLSPNSDHNTGLAVDLTHDPKNGIDCAEIFQRLKEDNRVDYLIFSGKIWSRKFAKQGDRKYTGSNPHDKHLHVSIRPEFAGDTSPWFWWRNQPSLTKQLVAEAIGGTPKKKVAKGTILVPVCTCCKVHGKANKKGK
jgi:hypothetical protein